MTLAYFEMVYYKRVQGWPGHYSRHSREFLARGYADARVLAKAWCDARGYSLGVVSFCRFDFEELPQEYVDKVEGEIKSMKALPV